MKKKEQWKKLMSVRDSLDGFPEEKFEEESSPLQL